MYYVHVEGGFPDAANAGVFPHTPLSKATYLDPSALLPNNSNELQKINFNIMRFSVDKVENWRTTILFFLDLS